MSVKISYRNWVDAESTVIAADSEAGDFVGANVQNRLGYKVWRTDGLTTGSTDAGITIEFGASRAVQAVAIAFPRTNDPGSYDETPDFGASDTVRVRLYLSNVEVFDSGVGASGVDPGHGMWALWMNAEVQCDEMRIDLDAISRDSEGFVDVARIWAGPMIAPRVGVSYGANRQWTSDSIIAKAARGESEFVTPQESLRQWSLTLDWLDDAEAEEIDDFERVVTGAGQFLAHWGTLPAGKRDMLCRQSSGTGFDASRFGINRKQLRLIESR